MICQRCAVTFAKLETGERYTFADVAGALRHAIEFHGNKVADEIFMLLDHVQMRDFVLRVLSDADRPKSPG